MFAKCCEANLTNYFLNTDEKSLKMPTIAVILCIV